MDQASKRCCTCKEDKTPESFAKNRSSKDGRHARCRDCVREHYQRNRDKVIARVAKYKEDNPEKVRESKRKYRTVHRERVIEQQRVAYRKNPEHYREARRVYRRNNLERITEANRAWIAANPTAVQRIKSQYKHRRRMLESENGIYSVTHRDLNRMLNRADNACVYCRHPFNDERKVTWDHIIPVTRGGTYSVGNLVPCCVSCNSSKQNRTVMEWRMWRKRNITDQGFDLSSLTILGVNA